MPRIATRQVSVENKTIKFTVNVNSDGEFSTTLDREDAAFLREANVETGHNRLHNDGYFKANTLNDLMNQIEDALKNALSREMIEEKIILRYSIYTACSYQINEKNEIVPNGHWNKNGDGNWRDGTIQTDALNREPYGISIYVNPEIKETYRYRNGDEKIEYRKYSTNENEITDENYYLSWLADIVSISKKSYHAPETMEIDYNEETAKFFVEIIKSICLLNERIKDFINPESIRTLIENKIKLIAGG